MNKKRILKYAVVLLLAAGMGYAIKHYFFPEPVKPKYLTAKADRGHIEDTVLATGTLEALKQVSVGAQVSGQIKSLKVALGDQVKEGDVIAEIDSLPQQNILRDAEAALANIKAQRMARAASLKQAELAFKRQQTMLKADASSKEAYETAEATLAVTKADIASLDAQISQAEINVDTAKVNLGYATILAPIDGTVVAIVTKEGQTVNAAQAAPTIIKLAQLNTMTIKAEISEADVPKVKPGQKIYFTILGEPEKRYYSTLRAVEPAPDTIIADDASSTGSSTDQAIYYNGLFDVENPDGKLRISMTAQVTIVLNESEKGLLIPSTALGEKTKDGFREVRVLKPGDVIEKRKVKIGINNNIKAEVLEGLSENDTVVTGEASVDENAPAPAETGRRPRVRI